MFCRTSGSGIKNQNILNKELAVELHKQSPFTDNIWGVDLADMQLTSKFNKFNKFNLDFSYV